MTKCGLNRCLTDGQFSSRHRINHDPFNRRIKVADPRHVTFYYRERENSRDIGNHRLPNKESNPGLSCTLIPVDHGVRLAADTTSELGGRSTSPATCSIPR